MCGGGGALSDGAKSIEKKMTFCVRFSDHQRCPRSPSPRTRDASDPNHQPNSAYRAARAARQHGYRAGSKTPEQAGARASVKQGYYKRVKIMNSSARVLERFKKKGVLGCERRSKSELGKVGREERVAGPALADRIVHLAARVRRRIAPPPPRAAHRV